LWDAVRPTTHRGGVPVRLSWRTPVKQQRLGRNAGIAMTVALAGVDSPPLRPGQGRRRTAHRGAQPGAHPTWDLSSVTTVELMADLVTYDGGF
jgi:hypothetical protein